MSRRSLAVAALVLMAVAPTAVASAQTPDRLPLDLSGALTNAGVPATLLAAEQLGPSPYLSAERTPRARGSSLLHALYGSTFAMQALDVHSTLKAFSLGAGEGNPLMAGVARHKLAFIGLKAGVAASTVLAARNMAKTNKIAAIATLIGINSAYAMIVSHNYKVASHLR